VALNTIKRKLFTQLETLTLPSGVTIHYPNVNSTVPTDSHLVPTVLPNTTRPVGIVSTDREAGLLQVTVYIKVGTGELLSSDIAQVILDGFARNLDLDGVRIDASGSIGPSFSNDGGWNVTPISIPYINID